MFGCDVIVHIGVHLASKETLMAVEELCTLLVKYHLAESSSIHIITKLRMNGAHVDLHVLIISASETTVVTVQAQRWFVRLLTHFHLQSTQTAGP